MRRFIAVVGAIGLGMCGRASADDPSGAATFRAGDTVAVTADGTQVMAGPRVLGTVPRGETYTVREVSGEWVGVDFAGARGWVRATPSSKNRITSPCLAFSRNETARSTSHTSTATTPTSTSSSTFSTSTGF